MNEKTWVGREDSDVLLRFLQAKPDRKVLWAFVINCLRRVRRLADDATVEAIESLGAEDDLRFVTIPIARGVATYVALAVSFDETKIARACARAAVEVAVAGPLAMAAPFRAGRRTSASINEDRQGEERRRQCELLRSLIDPFTDQSGAQKARKAG